jgi:hypothetical protein
MSGLLRTGMLASAASALLWLAACAPPVQAAEKQLSVGRGFICDTPEEVEAVLTPHENDISARLANVNDRFGKDACTFATSVFYSREDAKTALTPEGVVRIEKVQLVGYLVGDELRIAKPAEQYFGVVEAAASLSGRSFAGSGLVRRRDGS